MVPRQRVETRSPVLPRVLYCMAEILPVVGARVQVPCGDWMAAREIGFAGRLFGVRDGKIHRAVICGRQTEAKLKGHHDPCKVSARALLREILAGCVRRGRAVGGAGGKFWTGTFRRRGEGEGRQDAVLCGSRTAGPGAGAACAARAGLGGNEG